MSKKFRWSPQLHCMDSTCCYPRVCVRIFLASCVWLLSTSVSARVLTQYIVSRAAHWRNAETMRTFPPSISHVASLFQYISATPRIHATCHDTARISRYNTARGEHENILVAFDSQNKRFFEQVRYLHYASLLCFIVKPRRASLLTVCHAHIHTPTSCRMS